MSPSGPRDSDDGLMQTLTGRLRGDRRSHSRSAKAPVQPVQVIVKVRLSVPSSRCPLSAMIPTACPANDPGRSSTRCPRACCAWSLLICLEAYPELYRVLRDALGSPADPAELRLAESFAEQLLDWLERSYRRHIDERTKAEAAEILIAMVNLRTALARPRYQGPTSRSSEADAS